jgi:hypothetical protein
MIVGLAEHSATTPRRTEGVRFAHGQWMIHIRTGPLLNDSVYCKIGANQIDTYLKGGFHRNPA